FSVNGNDLQIVAATDLDFEAKPSYDITVTVTDSGSATFAENFTINLTDINEGPQILLGAVDAVLDNVTMSEDASPTAFALTSALTAVDEDTADTLTWGVTTDASNGTLTVSGTGTTPAVFTYVPSLHFNGSDSFTINVTDGAISDTFTVNVTIDPVDDTPYFTSTEITTINEDSVYTYNITAADIEGSTLTITAPTLPSWLTGFTDNGDGSATLTGTPTNDFVGDNSISLLVSDGALNSAQSYTLSVANTNDAPSTSDESFDLPESAENNYVVGSVSGSDIDVGDSVYFSIVSGDKDNLFAIDAAGQITVKDRTQLDYETATIHALTIQVRDRSDTEDADLLAANATVTVSVLDVTENYNLVADSAFGNNGHSKVSSHIAMRDSEFIGGVEQSDGKLVAVGNRTDGSVQSITAVRFTANGELDPTFADNGYFYFDEITTDTTATGIAVFNDDIYIAGQTTSGGYESPIVMKLDASSGYLDTAFGDGASGYSIYSFGYDVYPDGLIVRDTNSDTIVDDVLMAASVDSIGYRRIALLSYPTDGNGTPTISLYDASTDSVGSNQYVNFIVEEPDTDTVLVGGYSVGGSTTVGRIVRFDNNGDYDASYGDSGSQSCNGDTYASGSVVFCVTALPTSTDVFNDAVIYDNGTEEQLVIVGHTNQNNYQEPLIARFTNAGILDTTFGSASSGYNTFYDGSNAAEATSVVLSSGELVTNYQKALATYADFQPVKVNLAGTAMVLADETEISLSDDLYPLDDKMNKMLVTSDNNIVAIGTANEDWDLEGTSERTVGAIAKFTLANIAAATNPLNVNFSTAFDNTDNGYRRVPLSRNTEDEGFYDQGLVRNLIHLDDANNVYIAADGLDFNESSTAALLKLDADSGQVNTSYQYNGTTTPIYEVDLQASAVAADGTQYILYYEDLSSYYYITKYDSSGTLDLTFSYSYSPSGPLDGADIVVDNNGKIVFVGYDSSNNELVFERIATSGSSETSQTTNLNSEEMYLTRLYSIAVDPVSNEIVVMTSGDTNRLTLFKFNTSGELNSSNFGTDIGEGTYNGYLEVDVEPASATGETNNAVDVLHSMVVMSDSSIVISAFDNGLSVLVGMDEDGLLFDSSTGYTNWDEGILDIDLTSYGDVISDVTEVNGDLVLLGTAIDGELSIQDNIISLIDMPSGAYNSSFATNGVFTQDLAQSEAALNIEATYDKGEMSIWFSSYIPVNAGDAESIVISKYSSTTSFAPVVLEGVTVAASHVEDTTAQIINLSAYDGEGDDLTWTISTDASDGTAVLTDNGDTATLSYVPDGNFYGVDTVIVTVSDGTNSDTVTINVTVTNVNDVPVISEGNSISDNLEVDTDITVSLNATDVDSSDVLTWSIMTAPTNGSAIFPSGSSGNSTDVQYTPSASFEGSDSLVVKISDGNGGEDTITINLEVLAFNDLPIANDASYNIYEAAANNTAIATFIASDANTLTYSITSGNEESAFAINAITGAITVADSTQLDYEVKDTYNLVVSAVDDSLISKSDTANVTITIDDIIEKETPTLDASFGTSGEWRLEPAYSTSTTSVAFSSNNDVYLGVGIGTESGVDFGIAAITNTGANNTAFNSTGLVQDDYTAGSTHTTFDIKYLADGKTLLLSVVDYSPANLVLSKYNVDGSLDTAFGSSGRVVYNQTGIDMGGVIGIDSNDNIYITGYNGESNNSYLAAYDSTGTVRNIFGAGNDVLFSLPLAVNDIAFDAADNVYIAGQYLGAVNDAFVAKVDPSETESGYLDLTWGTAGYQTYTSAGFYDEFLDIEFDESGNLYAAGVFDDGTYVYGTVVKYSNLGAQLLANNFDFAESEFDVRFNAMQIIDKERLMVTGYLNGSNGVELIAARILLETVELDTTFNTVGYLKRADASVYYNGFGVKYADDLTLTLAGAAVPTGGGVDDIFAVKYDIDRQYYPHVLEGEGTSVILDDETTSVMLELNVVDIDGDSSAVTWSDSGCAGTVVTYSTTTGASSSLTLTNDSAYQEYCDIDITVIDAQGNSRVFVIDVSASFVNAS
uniref:tandem-95 repeat protein n=1 Tax=Algibacillus agarilyticus TaxID=2234133 RepID=UPI0013002878